MIPVARTQAPAHFQEKCLNRGIAWLAENPEATRPRNYWSEFTSDLRAAFKGRCGWGGFFIHEGDGQVDHFEPCSRLLKSDRRHQVYDWDNLRYAWAYLNNIKRGREVLDPFIVEPGWFKVDVLTLHVVMTERVPSALHNVARSTLEMLSNHQLSVKRRWHLYDAWVRDGVTLEYVQHQDPLLGEALELDLKQGKDWRKLLPASGNPREVTNEL